MSTVKIVENVQQVAGGRPVPALDFVRQNTQLAAAISKATPGVDRVTRDSTGNRKLASPDYASVANVHRTIARRNKDAKMTLQMLPDLKLGIEMVVSLIMSPKDMFNDEVNILADCSDLLPASIMQSLLKVTTDYYRKNHHLSEFTQRMLMEVMAWQGALPVAVIPENSLDDLINNYNTNITLEQFKTEFDVERNIALPTGLLGVPDYLNPQINKTAPNASTIKFGASVTFDLQSFDNARPMNVRANSANAGIAFSKLMSKEGSKEEGWKFTAGGVEHDADDLVVVTDNASAMKLPQYRTASLENRVNSVLKKKGFNKHQVSIERLAASIEEKYKLRKANGGDVGEGNRKLADSEVESLIFKNRRFAFTPVAALRNNIGLKRNSVGESMIKEFDTACFIPVSVEGDAKRKLGGYVMLDEDGYPLTTNSPTPDEIGQLAEMAAGGGNFISTMNERSNQILNGKACTDVSPILLKKFFTRAFSEMVEKDLIDRVKNGQYDNGVQLGSNEDFYWLMLTRCLRGQRTQLLWIPEEFLVYFAVDYDELGFGKSLLDDIRNLTSMRIMMLVSGIEASMRNSIGRTKVSIKLDEEDPDAEKSLEDIQDEILKSRMNPIPFGINNVADISKYLQRACYEFEISGSTALPDMQVSFEQFNSNYPKPDVDLQEQMKDLTIQHIGLTRDMIDASEGVEFAIQAATSNMMTMKRVQRWQRLITPHLTDYVRKISRNSESQIDSYREILTNNFEQMQVAKLKSFFGFEDIEMLKDEDFKKLVVEQCISEFVNTLVVELPNPGASTMEAQKQAFSDAAEFYTAALEHVVSEAFFDSALQGEELSTRVDMMRSILLSHYMRQYMADNNILPELAELTTIGEDGKVAVNIMDSLEVHVKALGMSTEGFFRRFKAFANMQSALMQDVGESSTDAPSSSDSGGSDDSGGGNDDFDMGGDFPEMPADDTPPEDEEEEEGGPDDTPNPDEETPPE